jgi:hypothetical protein
VSVEFVGGGGGGFKGFHNFGVGIFPVSIHDSGVLSVRNCRVGFRRVRIYPVTVLQ